MIPSCLKLREDQIEKVRKWRNLLKKYDDYDDVSCASDVTFHIYATGLGDVIVAECQGQKCNLTIDDDGELCD
jgi:hypothetical protein